MAVGGGEILGITAIGMLLVRETFSFIKNKSGEDITVYKKCTEHSGVIERQIENKELISTVMGDIRTIRESLQRIEVKVAKNG